MRIYAQNPVITDNPNTNLSASSLAGVASLSWYNSNGFSATTNILLLGNYGDEQAEIVKSSATTTSSITLSAGTLFPHAQDTSVTYMTYDEVEFSRSDDGGSTWTTLGLVGLQPTRNSTVYVDNAGQSTSLWRFRFYNSLTSTYSSYSTSLGSSGYSTYQLEAMQNKVISLFNDPNLQFLSYQDITDWVNECSEQLAGEIYMSDRMGLIGTVNTTLASTNTFTLPNDFVSLKRLAVSYDSGTTYYRASPIALDNSLFNGQQYISQQQFNQTQPVYYKQDNTVIIYPSATNPTNYQLTYYRLPTNLVNPQDSLDLIFRPFTSLFIDYCLYRAKMKAKEEKNAQMYFQAFNLKKVGFIEQMTKWQLDEPDFVDSDDFDYVMGTQRIPGRL